MKKKVLIGILIATILLGIGCGIFYFVIWNPAIEEVKLEVGEKIQLQEFLKDPYDGVSFVTDVSAVDTSVPGEHDITLKVYGRKFTSKLIVEDTVAPTGTGVDIVTEGGVMPTPEMCVTDIQDMTDVTIAFKETPDVSQEGDVNAVVVLTDEGGNTTEINSVITVWVDKEPPVISGAKNKTVTVGGSVSYRSGVTVTDNKDEDPTLEIDNSNVDLNKIGVYEVVYTATDKSGNVSTETINVTVKEKAPAVPTEISEATVNALAQDVLGRITNDSMSKMDIAFAIYKWTNTNIGYTGSSDKSNWVNGAYQGFTKKAGDCYTYFAVAKALFNVAGISNVDVVKSDTSHSRHYWSLIDIGSGWYHVDCTPRKGSGDLFFMVTDAELEAYSSSHSNSHIFDGSLYPARATESVQHLVSY